jgi:Phytanoyl-CoA dioxygenase (PhyH)
MIPRNARLLLPIVWFLYLQYRHYIGHVECFSLVANVIRTPKNYVTVHWTAIRNDDSASSGSGSPTYGLYEVQEEMLIQRGIYEEQLMSSHIGIPLKANVPKGLGGGGTKGFGSNGKTSKARFYEEAKSHASKLRKDGLVRIDNVISGVLADQMYEFVSDLRQESLRRVSEGTWQHADRFADVLLRTNRCDLKIPLGNNGSNPTPVVEALYQVLCESAVKETITTAFMSDQAVLYELSCMISDPGSHRQVVHPDNPVLPDRIEPTLLTCFIALQDIDVTMGPTIFIPGTHTAIAHAHFAEANEESNREGLDPKLSPKDTLLRDTKSVVGTLTKGYVPPK